MAGRPPKFQTPQELEEKINGFLVECNDKGIHPTKGQLALYLDTTRETLSDYEKKEGYSDAIKRVYAIIEEHWVQQLTKQSVTGIIFYLKNAYSREWRDRSEVENEHKGEMTFAWLPSNSNTPQENGPKSSTTPPLAG